MFQSTSQPGWQPQKHQQLPIIFPHHLSIFSIFPSPSPAIQAIFNFIKHFIQSSQCEPPSFPCLLPIRTKPNIYPYKIPENIHTTIPLHNPPRILTRLLLYSLPIIILSSQQCNHHSKKLISSFPSPRRYLSRLQNQAAAEFPSSGNSAASFVLLLKLSFSSHTAYPPGAATSGIFYPTGNRLPEPRAPSGWR